MSAAYDSLSIACAASILEVEEDERTPIPDPPASGVSSLVGNRTHGRDGSPTTPARSSTRLVVADS